MELTQEQISELVNTFEELIKPFRELWDKVKELIESVVETIKNNKKATFKPVLRLIPFKKWLRDKRLSINLCRNNC